MRDICDDCGRDFTGLMTIVSDDDWRAISPRGDAHGLLCPWCMGRRFSAIGRFVKAEMRFEACGLLAANSEAMRLAERIDVQRVLDRKDT
jgi:hypothetical protein